MNLKNHIRQIPDFPKPGINFFDISTLIGHPKAWKRAIDDLAEALRGYNADYIAGIDARGFLVAAPLGIALDCGVMMIRKKGKLPGETKSHSYDLEYGTDAIEIQHDAVKPGDTIIIVDDLLATGGTLAAAVALLKNSGAEVAAAACLIELSFLQGRARIDMPCHTLVTYDTE
ncbi:MAG: adenine phosphoribosyltransferase [Rhodospirillaceae bacterium]